MPPQNLKVDLYKYQFFKKKLPILIPICSILGQILSKIAQSYRLIHIPNFVFYKGSFRYQEVNFATHVGSTCPRRVFCTDYPPHQQQYCVTWDLGSQLEESACVSVDLVHTTTATIGQPHRTFHGYIIWHRPIVDKQNIDESNQSALTSKASSILTDSSTPSWISKTCLCISGGTNLLCLTNFLQFAILSTIYGSFQCFLNKACSSVKGPSLIHLTCVATADVLSSRPMSWIRKRRYCEEVDRHSSSGIKSEMYYINHNIFERKW